MGPYGHQERRKHVHLKHARPSGGLHIIHSRNRQNCLCVCRRLQSPALPPPHWPRPGARHGRAQQQPTQPVATSFASETPASRASRAAAASSTRSTPLLPLAAGEKGAGCCSLMLADAAHLPLPSPPRTSSSLLYAQQHLLEKRGQGGAHTHPAAT